MQKSTFHISKMDCPAEEQLIRLRLAQNSAVARLEFDLDARELSVYHQTGTSTAIREAIDELDLDSKLIGTEDAQDIRADSEVNERRSLWAVLAINFTFFLIELATGLISRSMGLLADSLDMLADSFVYGISLLAVGGTIARKKRIASLAGYFQIALALIGFIEVVRRFVGSERIPEFRTMIVVSILALIANAVCLFILQRSKSREVHMQASMIFTSNDVIINLGVIAAGLFVYWSGSNKPDLAIGTIVFVLVIRGGMRILKLGRQASPKDQLQDLRSRTSD